VRLEAAARDRRGEIGLLAMPWMLAATLPTGLLGLVVAGMLAASISTYAGYFLGWSSIIAQDIVAPLLHEELRPTSRRGSTIRATGRPTADPFGAEPGPAQGFASVGSRSSSG
jgi:hypothetical protein